MTLSGLIDPLGGIVSHEISRARARSKLALSKHQEQEIQESIKEKL